MTPGIATTGRGDDRSPRDAGTDHLADGIRVSVGVSIGGVVSRQVLHAVSLLVGRSDDALYRAERQARGSVQIRVLD